MPRVKNILNKIGTTTTIAMFYAPVIVFIYGYVVYDYMTNKPDESFAK